MSDPEAEGRPEDREPLPGWGRYWRWAIIDARGRCHYCGDDRGLAELEWWRFHIDHRVPKGKGGPLEDDRLNRVFACDSCNHLKGNANVSTTGAPRTMAERAEYIERARDVIETKRIGKISRWGRT